MNANRCTRTWAGILAMAIVLSGCGGSASSAPASAAPIASAASASSTETAKLVLYASTPEDFLSPLVAGFEQETGIKVELVEAGTGELMKRIEAEGINPLGDILLGGMVSSGYLPKKELFEEYKTPNEEFLPEQFRNTTGKVTGFSMVPSVIMLNTELLGEIEVKGYADLLKPELKGKIAMPDPSKTSSGWEQLVNMLYDMGDGDPEKGWDYVAQLVTNMEGKMLPGSSNVHKGVADGEYSVGLVAEAMVDAYNGTGKTVDKVFMAEGVVVQIDGVAIIKGAQNMESAKKFVDYLTSKSFQQGMGEYNRRPLRTDVDLGEGIVPTGDIKLRQIDNDYIAAHKEEMLNKFKEIATS